MESMVLMGAEQVGRAGHNMSSAAEQMNRAAGQIDEALRQHQRFLDDWLLRFEALISRGEPAI